MKKNHFLLIGATLMAGIPVLSATAVLADTTTTTTTATPTSAQGAPMDSQATFTVSSTDPNNPDTTSGKLILESVPSFAFGTVGASSIYQGFQNRASTVASDLAISDTRLGTNNWTLDASLAPFKSSATTPVTLTGSQLDLATTSVGGQPFQGTLTDDNQPIQLASGDGTTHGDFTYAFAGADNTLSLSANSSAILNQGDSFQAQLTWTLTSSGPTAPSLS